MLVIYIDADACPVKEDVFRIALRHNLQVYLVSNSRLNINVEGHVHKIQVGLDFDAVDNWIVDQISSGDIVVTMDILLADRCLKKGARAINPTGKVFTDSNIGAAKAMRELSAYLRETGVIQGHNATFSRKHRSSFLQAFEEMIQSIKRKA